MGLFCIINWLLSFITTSLFSGYILFTGVKGLADANTTMKIVNQTLTHIELFAKAHFDFSLSTSKLQELSLEIVFGINWLLIFGALLCFFRIGYKRFFIISGILLQLALVCNPLFYQTEQVRLHALCYVSIIGGALLK